jgi:hypothetical protein
MANLALHASTAANRSCTIALPDALLTAGGSSKYRNNDATASHNSTTTSRVPSLIPTPAPHAHRSDEKDGGEKKKHASQK